MHVEYHIGKCITSQGIDFGGRVHIKYMTGGRGSHAPSPYVVVWVLEAEGDNIIIIMRPYKPQS